MAHFICLPPAPFKMRFAPLGAGGVKFVGIDHNTPEKSIICPRLEDYFCGLVVTKHLDRKLFYTEMMSPTVRGLIEGKSKTPNDYNPLEWMMMLSARPR